ncbi:hypothetical protein [Mesorhizobium sp. Z1-4]|uniref:phage adaptor protein n=1 Tax=Mesorhizobium sp. Z1-4 TaxID=2448478 RepID=UPI000FD8F54A|nr:hypothetical protein [Mesorhizobium sp. Z1-4]
MAITDYASLKTAIGTHSKVSSLATDAVVDDFIRFATEYFNFGGDPDTDPPLRTRDMEAVSDLTPSSGVCTLPSDYLQYRRVVEKSSPRRELRFITPDQAEVLYPSRYSGPGLNFTIIGSSLYTLPLVSNDVELTHYQEIPNLTSGNTTNWLLTKNPQVYLRACLMFAAIYRNDDGAIAKETALTRSMVAGMNAADMTANYARAGLSIKGSTP